MAISESDLKHFLSDAFPEAVIVIRDLAGDGDHYAVEIQSSQFLGKTRIAQHQLVYAALQGRMGVNLHAMSIKTSVPST